MEVKKRPVKMFEVLIAHGPYRKGDKVQPTGIYRDVLLRRGIIREVAADPALELNDRMVREPRQELPLTARKRRH